MLRDLRGLLPTALRTHEHGALDLAGCALELAVADRYRWFALQVPHLKLLKRHKDGETLAEGEAKRITHDPEACHNLDALPPVTT